MKLTGAHFQVSVCDDGGFRVEFHAAAERAELKSIGFVTREEMMDVARFVMAQDAPEPVAQQPTRDLLAKMRALRDALADIESGEIGHHDEVKLCHAANVARRYIQANEANDE